MNRQKHYSDGTPITAPFYVCRCQNGHTYWSVTREGKCVHCGSDPTYTPADKKE